MSSDSSAPSRRTVLRTTAGAAGIAAGAGVAGGQEATPNWGGWLDGIDGGFEDARGQGEVTVAVGAEGNGGFYAFEPAGLWVDPGTTVRFEWTGQGGGHNVKLEEGPADLDSGAAVANAGVNYEYTFEQGGISTYFCEPHRGLGMLGAVAVGDDVPVTTPSEETPEGGPGPGLPGGPNGSFVMLVLLATGALGSLLVLGSDLWGRTRAEIEGPAEDLGPLQEAPAEEPVRTIEHDAFDPAGTIRLILIYFAILVVLWVFVYFVEFLGRGPTVIG